MTPDVMAELARAILITAVRGLEIEIDGYNDLDDAAQNELLARVLYEAVSFIGDIGGRVIRLWEEDRA